MIFLYLYNHQTYLVLLAFIFYLIGIIAIKYNKTKYIKPKYSATQKFKEEFLQYLDQYYITNKLYTFFVVVIYLFLHTFWILVYRFFYLLHTEKNNTQIIIPYENFNITSDFLVKMLSFVFLLIATIILFKIMLDRLFFKEIIKLHLYLLYFSKYHSMQRYLGEYYLVDSFGKLYLFFYNISRNEAVHVDSADDYYEFYGYHEIYYNHNVKYISKILLQFANKNSINTLIIKLITGILRWLYNNMRLEGFAYYIPYILLTFLIALNFNNKALSYANILFILCYSLIQLMNLAKFYMKRDCIYDSVISKYFYRNRMYYLQQKVLLHTNVHQFYNEMCKSIESQSLLHYIRDNNNNSLINYVFENYICFLTRNPKYKNSMKDFYAKHRRFYIVTLLLIGVYYIAIQGNNYTVVMQNYTYIVTSINYITIPMMLLLFYSANNIYRVKKEDLSDSDYISKPKYKVLFWILVIIQLYLFWILLIKANLFLITDGILWDHCGIKILRNYTLEEKIKYFYEHLDNILNILENKKTEKYYMDQLIYLIEELNWKGFILENTSILDTRKYVEKFVELYLEQLKLYLEAIKEKQLAAKEWQANKDTIMRVIANIISLFSFSKFVEMYIKAYHIAANPISYNTIKLVQWIVKFYYQYRR